MTGHNITQNRMIAGRAIISALALATLAFSGVAAGGQFYVNESGWWRDGGAFNASTAPIQAAVGAASAGDAIYVHGGNYYENVDVGTAHLTLEGEGADVVTVTAADPGDHVFDVWVDWVNISGFAVRGATDYDMAGIYLDNADYCNISENNIYGNYRGIYLRSSSNSTLTNNIANSNNYYGIYLSSSNSNTIANNTVNSNDHSGICMYSSSNNTLRNNTANSNNFDGIYFLSSNNNILTGNTANSNNDHGIGIRSSRNNTLTNNIANSNYRGIYFPGSNSNTLTNNTANSNDKYGIRMYSSSSNNMLTNNTASNNHDGIRLDYSSNNNTLINNIASNNYYGICMYSSSNNNTLTSNIASNNYYGIYLDTVDNNNITCNWVQDNVQYGFHLSSGSTGNNISYNNIVENGNYNTTSGGWEWQFYIDQYQHVEAKHNYWGDGMNNDTIDASVYNDDEGMGKVEFYPFETEPVQCPLTPKPPAFTTADAVIALQIAVGSRPPDLRCDASGDGSVTSLDALMIMQAAVGRIEVR